MSTLLSGITLKEWDNSGSPLVGGLLYTYAAGTSTPKATYSDAGGTTPNSNPVVLNSRGEADVFLSGTYKFVLCDSTGAVLRTNDNIGGSSTSSIAFGSPAGATLDVGGGLTLTSGVSSYILDTYGSASTQTLTSITGGAAGDLIQLQIVNASHVITVQNNANILIGADFTLNSLYDSIVLKCQSPNVWVQQYRSNNS